MSMHVYGEIVTAPGIAANNRGENEGNITTLQKILWNDEVHTTVSAEAIRWAIRYYWQLCGLEVNRRWDEEKNDHVWADEKWTGWTKADGKTYIDDDVLGYMKAEGGKTEGEKGRADKRRGMLEVARAISTTPFVGDITFNAKSGTKGRTSLYGTEVHATRYQYGFAMTPERLRDRSRALLVLDAIASLGEVAGNQSRFLFDFSPESVVLRITDDPAPRLLYCFQQTPDGQISAPELVRRVNVGDILGAELFIGGPIAGDEAVKGIAGASLCEGVKNAVAAFKKEVAAKLGIAG
jgi:CRISPR-associated protein Cst2